ncbi:sporulation protein [Glycomyces arizonensis]|uniref:sporulation protein n=1 Tax=Glycomyces arizonensis TaxID=256035 RepID=UPI00041F2980|nr:sporulation protein [Glycomyces arizonensis]
MVFNIVKSVFGVGVSVDTALTNLHVTPGGTLQGSVSFTGGEVAGKVEGIEIEYTAVVEDDSKGEEKTFTTDFFSAQVSGPFNLAPGTGHSIDFEAAVPWETPLSTVAGRPLPGMKLGVSTKLALDNAFDKGDMDELTIEPLPVQTAVMDALEGLGFVFQSADLEKGTIAGSHMPFYQEVEYWATGEFADKLKEVEVTFVASQSNTDVILQTDNPGGLLTPDHNRFVRFGIATDDGSDATEAVRAQLEQLIQRKGI